MTGPIPQHLVAKFAGHMDITNNNDLPDGAWLQFLEDSARAFMCKHNLRGDALDAIEQYADICNERAQKEKEAKS